MTGLGKAALTYAERIKWAVHPLKPNAKTPISSHGFKDASIDPGQIRSWWLEHPRGNIGIATGAVNRISVLDVDVKDGAGGAETLAALLAEHSATLEGHARQTTWSGGWQYVFAYDSRARHGANCYGLGLDGRNDGGYIVGSPSVVNGRPYTWSGAAQPQPMPEWLIELAPAGAVNGHKTYSSPPVPAPPDQAALVMLRQWLAAAKPGTSGLVRCPAHPDRSPSLQVWKLADGQSRFRCWGPGCSADVIDAMVCAPADAGAWPLDLPWTRGHGSAGAVA